MSPIDPRLQAALDDERDPGELPADLRETYARLMSAAEVLAPTPLLSVATRVMADIQRLPSPAHLQADGKVRRLLRWLGRPREVTVHLRPVWTLALAGALAAVVLLPSQLERISGPRTSLKATEGVAHFVGHFPGAHSVEVVGSFNDWRPGSLHLRDHNHNGVWDAAAVLPAGPHEYMFVVDGDRWVADPLAGRYVDDGFGAGQENAVLIVRPATLP